MTTVLTCTRADNVSLSNIVDFEQVNLTIQFDMTKVLTCAGVNNVSLSNIDCTFLSCHVRVSE